MRSLILAFLLITASCAEASPYRIEPAPALLPTPTATLAATVAPTAVTATGQAEAAPAKPPKRAHKGTATPTPTPSDTPTITATATAEAPLFYLQPFADKRRGYQIYQGKSNYDSIRIQAQGITAEAKAWSEKPFGDMAFLWHRQAGQALAKSGLSVVAPQDPGTDELGAALAMAAGARYLITGELKRFEFEKHGADLLGTSFTGTNYELYVQIRYTVKDLLRGEPVFTHKMEYKHVYYDPKRLGNDDSKTYPGFFVAGLEEAAFNLSAQEGLRALSGLAPFTPTPTPTRTSQAVAPADHAEPTATVEPTPDNAPYWANPKTGAKVDPNWNFDPSDGTPRKDFILRKPEAKAPGRATEQK